MKFIDLFAGLGGFHQALSSRGAECVFASELNTSLAELYEKNFCFRPAGDIREVKIADIPDHDVLCAGFPCQPFSKAGSQKGLQCPQWGDLFDYIVKILNLKKPRFFIIENVPNLISHNRGKTWSIICSQLEDAGYTISFERLSPHMFGIPQKRERAFIVGGRDGLGNFVWPTPKTIPKTSINSVLDDDPPEAHRLNENHLLYLRIWQDFIASLPTDHALPSFPIWAMEFGADYPLEGRTPHARGYTGLDNFKGAFGIPLAGFSPELVRASLPSYARTTLDKFPLWKIGFIERNRAFYKEHRAAIDPWVNQIKQFPPSFQKLEWNCKDAERSIWRHIVQFRASGIRVKKQDTAPSLITMTSHGTNNRLEKRYMTPRECSRLQGMDALTHLPETKNSAYKAFGNAVNVNVVRNIYDALINGINEEGATNEVAAAK